MTKNIESQYASIFFDKTHDIGGISVNAPDDTTVSINRFEHTILFTAGFKNQDVSPYKVVSFIFKHGDDTVSITVTHSVDVSEDETFTRTYIHVVERNDIEAKHTAHIIGKNGWTIDGGVRTETINFIDGKVATL